MKIKGPQTMEELAHLTGNQKLEYYNCGYAHLNTVETLGEEILKTHDRIDIIVNNPGIRSGALTVNQRISSKDGIESRFSVNYLAQFD